MRRKNQTGRQAISKQCRLQALDIRTERTVPVEWWHDRAHRCEGRRRAPAQARVRTTCQLALARSGGNLIE